MAADPDAAIDALALWSFKNPPRRNKRDTETRAASVAPKGAAVHTSPPVRPQRTQWADPMAMADTARRCRSKGSTEAGIRWFLSGD